jgi:hypothetical protein
MGEKQASEVIGFLLDETLPVPNAPPPPAQGGVAISADLKPIQRIKGLVDTATQAHDKAAIDAFEDLVVRLPAKTYGTTEFDMLEARRTALIAAGRNVTESYLTTRLQPGPGGMESVVAPSAADEELADRRAIRMLAD